MKDTIIQQTLHTFQEWRFDGTGGSTLYPFYVFVGLSKSGRMYAARANFTSAKTIVVTEEWELLSESPEVTK